eukprot:6941700-Heterocapsa_arctica.AAC.1
MGQDCTGPPDQGSCRFWRMRRHTLTRHSMGLTLLRGRNADWPIQEVAAAGGGQILRMLLAGPGP